MLGACFDPHPKDGVSCEGSYLCPPGYSCESSYVCTADDSSAPDDVSSIEGSFDNPTLIETTRGPILVARTGASVVHWYLEKSKDTVAAIPGPNADLIGTNPGQLTAAEVERAPDDPDDNELWVLATTSNGLELVSFRLSDRSVSLGATELEAGIPEGVDPISRSLNGRPLDLERMAVTWRIPPENPSVTPTRSVCALSVVSSDTPQLSCTTMDSAGTEIDGLVVDETKIGVPLKEETTTLKWVDCANSCGLSDITTDATVVIDHTRLVRTDGVILVAGTSGDKRQLLRIDDDGTVQSSILDGRKDQPIPGARRPAVAVHGDDVVSSWRLERENGQLDVYARCHSLADIDTGVPTKVTARANHNATSPPEIVWSEVFQSFVGAWVDGSDGSDSSLDFVLLDPCAP